MGARAVDILKVELLVSSSSIWSGTLFGIYRLKPSFMTGGDRHIEVCKLETAVMVYRFRVIREEAIGQDLQMASLKDHLMVL